MRIGQLLDAGLKKQGRYFRGRWSLVQFLKNREHAGSFWCDPQNGHRQIAIRLLERWGGLESGLLIAQVLQKAEYGSRHLVAHLIDAGVTADVHRLLGLETILDGRKKLLWLSHQEKIGSPQTFLNDVRRARHMMVKHNRHRLEQGEGLSGGELGREVRYGLMEASLRSLSGIPSMLILQPVETDFWTSSQALTYANMDAEASHRAEVLIAIAERLGEGERGAVLAEALAAARGIEDEWRRAKVLIAIAGRLGSGELGEVLAAAREIEDEGERAKVITPIILKSSPMPLAESYDCWQEILSRLVTQTRPVFLSSLTLALPILERLGGQEVLRETYRAVWDVYRWWP